MKIFLKTICVTIGLFMCAGAASAQSGRAVMKGYVVFEGLAYVDKQPRAKIELCSNSEGKGCATSAMTNEHGLFEINPAPLGEWWLRISAAGFKTYEISIYLPSDFIGNLAVMLKLADNKSIGTRRKVERVTTVALAEKSERPKNRRREYKL